VTTLPVAGAWRKARAERRPVTHTPLLLLLVAYAGRKLPSWRRVRTAVMQWSAFAAGTTALWGVDWRAGLAGVFVSLLCLEALGGADGAGRG